MTILTLLSPIDKALRISVSECLSSKTTLGEYNITQTTIASTITAITNKRRTAETAANAYSSRAHLLIRVFGEKEYGMFVDVSGDEESVLRGALSDEMSRDSVIINQDNSNFRRLLSELMSSPGEDIHVSVKRASVLNRHICKFWKKLKEARGGVDMAVRVLIAADGERVDLLKKSLAIIPEPKARK